MEDYIEKYIRCDSSYERYAEALKLLEEESLFKFLYPVINKVETFLLQKKASEIKNWNDAKKYTSDLLNSSYPETAFTFVTQKIFGVDKYKQCIEMDTITGKFYWPVSRYCSLEEYNEGYSILLYIVAILHNVSKFDKSIELSNLESQVTKYIKEENSKLLNKLLTDILETIDKEIESYHIKQDYNYKKLSIIPVKSKYSFLKEQGTEVKYNANNPFEMYLWRAGTALDEVEINIKKEHLKFDHGFISWLKDLFQETNILITSIKGCKDNFNVDLVDIYHYIDYLNKIEGFVKVITWYYRDLAKVKEKIKSDVSSKQDIDLAIDDTKNKLKQILGDLKFYQDKEKKDFAYKIMVRCFKDFARAYGRRIDDELSRDILRFIDSTTDISKDSSWIRLWKEEFSLLKQTISEDDNKVDDVHTQRYNELIVDKDLISAIVDNDRFDALFRFDNAIYNFGLLDRCNLENIDRLFYLIHRINIIKTKVHPQLNANYEAWLNNEGRRDPSLRFQSEQSKVFKPCVFFNEKMFNTDDRKRELKEALQPVIDKEVKERQDWYAVLRGAQSVVVKKDKFGKKHMVLAEKASDVDMFDDLCMLMPDLIENENIFPINDKKAEATPSSKYKTLRKALSEERKRWTIKGKGELLVTDWEKTEYIPSTNESDTGIRINNKEEKYRRMLQIGKKVKEALEQLRDKYIQS